MAERRDETIRGNVELDETVFVNCAFKDALLVYRGGTPPSFGNCTFTGSRFVFDGAAGNTLNFLRGMAQPQSNMRPVVLGLMPELTRN